MQQMSPTPDTAAAGPASGRAQRSWWPRPSVALVTILVASMAVALGYLIRQASTLNRTSALDFAARYTNALAEFRTLYTAEVVERVRDHGITVTHDYATQDGAIPLPATLSMLLGQRIGEADVGEQSRLYSAYPFPWREATGGLRDEFQRAAWAALTVDPETPFYRFVDIDGSPSLRYATADLMRPACIGCHNTHPDTPKDGWMAGDVRGVLEVSIPMVGVQARTHAGLMATAAAIAFAGLGLLATVLIGQRRSHKQQLEVAERTRSEEELKMLTTTLETQVRERTKSLELRAAELERLNSELERFNRLAVGRELRMIELKQQVNEMLEEAGKPAAYDLSTDRREV